MKRAILQVADTGPLESLVIMLRSIGYQCFTLSSELRHELRRIGCDTVLGIDDLVRSGSYDRPMALPEARSEDMHRADLYVDVKAHRSYSRVVRQWPQLTGKVLWYRINGGKPEHVIKADGTDCGDEVNPPCPVLTPNQWYREHPRAYACWPPFYRFNEYKEKYGRQAGRCTPPVCLVHNLEGWGYGALVPEMEKLGVRMHGSGCRHGVLEHSRVPRTLSTALAMVHLKSNDAPGYALYEAMAAGCPVVCTKRLVWRCQMHALLEDDVTCLTFDRETHDGLSPEDVQRCAKEVAMHLGKLKEVDENRFIGMTGHDRLRKLMWNERRDGEKFRAFMEQHYGNV